MDIIPNRVNGFFFSYLTADDKGLDWLFIALSSVITGGVIIYYTYKLGKLLAAGLLNLTLEAMNLLQWSYRVLRKYDISV